jgi:hypothetical protein
MGAMLEDLGLCVFGEGVDVRGDRLYGLEDSPLVVEYGKSEFVLVKTITNKSENKNSGLGVDVLFFR